MLHQAETGVTQPLALRFAEDGVVPNHPRWPLLLYRSAVELPAGKDPAAVIEALFASHGWGRSWRNGIFPFVHYHAQVHEVLGLARGHARVRFGGDEGETVDLTPGDIAVLPAGTGHQCLSKSADLLVVGAYPPGDEIDLRRGADDHDAALAAIARVPPPRSDPVRGDGGPSSHNGRDVRLCGGDDVGALITVDHGEIDARPAARAGSDTPGRDPRHV